MGKRIKRVQYNLDSGDVKYLGDEDVRAILRAADGIIGTGGRSMLTKILKGSKDKKVLEYGLDRCPTYGYYQDLTLDEISTRVDWMIKKGYLKIEYDYRLPTLVFTDMGWEIERETYAQELLMKLFELLDNNDYRYVHELKDRNRGMILLLIHKIRQTGDTRFVPLLKAWKEIEYKKVQVELEETIDYLTKEGTS